MLCQEYRAAMQTWRGEGVLSPDTFITWMGEQSAASNRKISKCREIILTQGLN